MYVEHDIPTEIIGDFIRFLHTFKAISVRYALSASPSMYENTVSFAC